MDPESEIFFLDINDDTSSSMEAQGFKKSVKTANSRRRVPLHPHLLELGFRQFAEQAQSDNRATLFNVQAGQDGDAGVYVSKWFQRFRKQIGIVTSGAKKDFHSFRHTFINALEDFDVNADVNRDLAGHGHGDTNRDRYRKTAHLVKLHKAISAIDFSRDLDKIKPYPNTL